MSCVFNSARSRIWLIWTAVGSALDYATYLGGSDQDSIVSLALDDAGDVHVTGLSFSTNSPVTVGALQTSSKGLADALVAKITPGSPPPVLTSVSAASFDGAFGLASESIASGFGEGLAGETAVATSLPLPTVLAGTSVRVTDSAGGFRLAPLFFVSAEQINYLMPDGTAAGLAKVSVEMSGQEVASGTVQINSVAPALFSADAKAAKDRPPHYSYVLTQTDLTLRCGPLIQIRELRFRLILARKVTKSSCFCSEQEFAGLLPKSGRQSAEKASRSWAPSRRDSSLGSTR